MRILRNRPTLILLLLFSAVLATVVIVPRQLSYNAQERGERVARPARCETRIAVPHQSFHSRPRDWDLVTRERAQIENAARQTAETRGINAAIELLTCSGFECRRIDWRTMQGTEYICAWPDGLLFSERPLRGTVQWCALFQGANGHFLPYVGINSDPSRRCLP